MSHCAGPTCDLPECHATPVGRGRRYCCDDHTAIGRNLANAKSRAAAAEREALRQALAGELGPLKHVGLLNDSQGLVLTGSARIEFLAVAAQLREVARAATEVFGPTPVTQNQLKARLGAVRRLADETATALQRLLT